MTRNESIRLLALVNALDMEPRSPFVLYVSLLRWIFRGRKNRRRHSRHVLRAAFDCLASPALLIKYGPVGTIISTTATIVATDLCLFGLRQKLEEFYSKIAGGFT